IIMFYEPTSINLLNYQQLAVSDGQWWRIFTSNFCHSNWNHWTLNIVGLWLMDVWYKPVISLKIRNYLLFFCLFANVALLHAFLNIGWYVGLSGALHGYLLGGAVISYATSKLVNSLIIVIMIIKLFVENTWQINSETSELIGAEVLEEAHLFGAIASLVFSAVFLLFYKKTT
ncbi:MAG: rhombosortase, partial [Kangiellaceae bacterium]|nr:rhombosortase [Kangiellaceae bacterium]